MGWTGSASDLCRDGRKADALNDRLWASIAGYGYAHHFCSSTIQRARTPVQAKATLHRLWNTWTIFPEDVMPDMYRPDGADPNAKTHRSS
jgi:hypothetical protein